LTKTDKILTGFKDFAKDNINDEHTLRIIMQSVYESKNDKLFEDLIFKAKYLTGLEQILSGKISTTYTVESLQATERIKNEYKDNYLKIREALVTINNLEDTNYKTDFENKFLSITHQSMLNLKRLIEDLSMLKKYMNQLTNIIK
jgi:hypothetical protein